MQSTHLNVPEAQIDMFVQSLLIRAAILIANNVCVSPADRIEIMRKDIFLNNKKSIKLETKLKYIEHYAGKFDEENGNNHFVETFTKVLPRLKQLKSVKHAHPTIIKEIKFLESHFDSAYENAVIYGLEEPAKKSMSSLLDLLSHEIFTVYTNDVEDEDKCEVDNLTRKSKLDLMKYDITADEATDSILFPLGEFTSNEKVFPNYFSVNDEEAKDKNNCWFENVIDVTGIHLLSSSDLLAVRKNLAHTASSLNTVMDEWMSQTLKDSQNFDDIDYYKTKVENIVNELNDTMEKDIIMSALKDWKERLFLQIGSMPVKEIWQYYHRISFLSDEELETLMKGIHQPAYAGRWPVFSLSYYNPESGKMYQYGEINELKIDTNPTKRKVISLD
jgi:hypothetical protein